MSIEDIFNEFDEEKKEDKTVPEKPLEPSKEAEGASIPDESKEEAKEKAPTPLKEEDADDWFESAEEAPAGDKPEEDQPIKEEAASEIPAEETPASEALAEAVDDWFEPAEEEPASDKIAEDKPVEEEAAGETPAAEATTEVDDWFAPVPEEQAPTEISSKVSADMSALVGVKTSPIVVPAVSAAVMRESMKQFQNLKAGLLDKNKDVATIQNKPYIKRSGWRKLGLAFNLSDEIVKEVRDEIEGGFLWRIWVRVWAPNGRSVLGVGACASVERDFAHLQHDVYATAHTRAKNRALSDMIGSGEVSWEELRGFDNQ